MAKKYTVVMVLFVAIFEQKFWHENPETYGDVVFQPDALPAHIHGRPLAEEDRKRLVHYGREERPLFIGHYWCSGTPSLVTPNIACLDYSAINGGYLVAYRMGSEAVLNPANFVWVDAN